MRKLLIVLLLSGCSSLELSGGMEGAKTDAEKIHQAESQCQKSGEFNDASEYNACVDNALGEHHTARAIVAERTARAKSENSSTGLAESDRTCERYGHVIGTEAYDTCIDYAKENQANAGKLSRY